MLVHAKHKSSTGSRLSFSRITALAALLLCLASAPLFGQTTWTAGAGTTQWDDAFNWDSGVPGAATPVTIPSVPVGGMIFPILNVNGATAALTIEAGASLGVSTRTLTVNGTLSGAGTLNGNTGTLTVSGDFTIATYNATTMTTNVGGDFTPGAFVHNNGTVIFNGGAGQSVNAYTFQNLTVNKAAGTLTTAAGTVTVNAALQVTAGTLGLNTNNTALTVNGATTIAGTLTAGTGALDFNGNVGGGGTLTASSGTSSIAGNLTVTTFGANGGTAVFDGGAGQSVNAYTFQNLTVNKAAGTLTTAAGTVTVNAALQVTAGTLGLNTNNTALTVNGATTIAGTLTAGTGALDFNGNVGGGGTLTASSGTSSFAGNLTVTTFGANGGTAVFDGGAGQSVNAYTFQNLTVNKAAGTLTTAAGTVTVNAALQVTAGTLGLNTNNTALTVNGATTIAGTLTAGTGALDFNGNVGGGGTLTASSGTSSFAGNLTVTTFGANGGTAVFDGGAGQAVNVYTFNNLTVSKAAGTLTTGAGTVNVGGALQVTSGTLGLNTNNTVLNVTGAATIAGTLTAGSGALDFNGNVSGAGTLTASSAGSNFAGNLTVTTFGANGGTAVFDGGAGQSVNAYTFQNLTVNKAGILTTAAGTVTVNAALQVTAGTLGLNTNNTALTVNGATTIAGTLTAGTGALDFNGNVGGGGTLTASSGTSSFAGNLTVTTFGANGGTAVFDGGAAQAVNVYTFNNLTVSKAAGTLTTGAGTVNVGGALQVTSGTLGLNTNNTVLNVTGAATIAGTLTAGSGALDFNGNVSGAGTLTASSAGSNFAGNLTVTTFGANGGTAVFDGGAAQAVNAYTFNNLTVSKAAGTLTTAAGPVSLLGTLTLTSGTLDVGANNMSVAGSFVRAAPGAFTSTGTLTFNGSAAQAFNPAGSTFGNLTINNSGPATVTLGAGLSVPGILTVSNGTFDVGNNILTVSGTTGISSSLILGNQAATFTGLVTNGAGGVLTGGSGSILLTGGVTGGTFASTSGTTTVTGIFSPTAFAHNSGTVEFNGGAAQSFGAYAFSNLTINNAAGVSVTAGPASVAGTLNLTSGTLAAGAFTLSFSGDLVRTGGAVTFTTGTLTLAGVAAQAVNLTGSTLSTLSVTKTGGTATVGSDFSAATYSQTGAGGTFSVPAARTMTVTTSATVTNGTLSLAGSYSGVGAGFTVNGGAATVGTNAFVAGAMGVSLGSFTQTGDNGGNANTVASLSVSGGTCTWDSGAAGGTLTISADCTQTAGSLAFNNKNVSIGGVLTGSVELYDLFIPNGVILSPTAGSTITVRRNVTIQPTGNYVPGTASLVLGGANSVAAGTITDSTGSVNLGTVTVSGAFTKALAASMRAGNLTITGTALNLSGNGLTATGSIAGTGSLVASGAEAISVAGSMTVTGFTQASSTVTFNGGAASACPGYTFYNLVLNMGALGTTLTPTAGITVTNAFTQTRGTFAAGTYTHLIAGAWDSSSANVGLTQGTSTIQLTSAAPVVTTRAGQSFYALTLNQGATLGSAVTVTNNFTAANNGAGGALGLAGYTLTVAGNLNLRPGAVGATLTAGTSAVVLNGGVQALTTNAQSFYDLTLSAGAGAVTPFGNLVVTNNLAVGAGRTLDLAANNVSVSVTSAATNAGTITQGTAAATLTGLLTNVGGTLNGGSGSITLTAGISGGFFTGTTGTAFVGGVFTPAFTHNSGTVQFNGGAAQTFGAYTFNNLTINNASGVSATGAATIAGNLVLSAGQWDVAGNAVNLAGNATHTAGTLLSTGTVLLNGAAAQGIDFSTSSLTNLTAGNAVGASLTADISLSGNFTVNPAAIFSTAGNDLTVSGNAAINGALNFAGAGTMYAGGNLAVGAAGTLVNAAGSTQILNGAALQTITPNAQTFGAVSMTGTGGVSMVGTATFSSLSVSVGETFTLGGGAATSLTVTGALTNAGTLAFQSTAAVAAVLSLGANSSNSGTLTLGASNAAGTATFSMANGRTLNNAGGTVQVSASVGTVTVSSPGTLTLTGNQLDLNGLALHVSGFSTAVAHTLDPSDNLILDGTAAFSGGLTLNGAGALVTVTTQTLNVSGGTGLTLTNGTVTVTTGTLNATSGLTVTNGVVSATTGTVNTGASGINLAATGAISFTGAGALSSGAVTNAGTITLAGGTVATGAVTNTGTIAFGSVAGAAWTAAGFFNSSGAVNNAFANMISASGNVTLSGAFLTPDNSTLRMTGSPTNLNATGVQIGYFIANAAGTVTLTADLSLTKDLTIQTGTLASGNRTITLDGNWYNATGVITRFTPGTGIVEFTNGTEAAISGPNQWYNLRYDQPGGTLRMERNRTQRILAGGTFQAIGTPGRIALTRDTPADDGKDLNWPVGAAPDPTLMWQLDKTGTANLDFQRVDIWYCDARSNPIAYNDSPLFVTLKTVVPDDVPIGEQGLTCYAWFNGMTAVYSYTEDSDDDGRIDGIKVTAQGALNMDFSDLAVTVAGYDIDTAVGFNGFTGTIGSPDFYIHLVEKPYLDASRTPSWTMTNNTALKSNAAPPNDYVFVLNLSDPMIPADTVPPRIAYTLTVPSTADTFFGFNETVERAGGGPVTSADIPGSASISIPGLMGDGDQYGIVATYGASRTRANILAELALTVNAGITDQATPLYNWATDPVASAYITTTPSYPAGSLPNPISLTSNVHRISDLLVSVPPSDTVGAWSQVNPNSFFVWPLWAKDEAYVPGVPDVDYPLIPETDASGQYVGFVRRFDGTRFLRDQDFELQVEDATGLGNPELLYKSNIADLYRSVVPGIWLPTFSEADFSGLASYPFAGFTMETGVGGPPIWNYDFSASDPEIYDRGMLEFYFRLPGGPADLYAGRLDMDPDATIIPPDWYRRVRPFGIYIRDLVTQRGGVTILNNVIDPRIGERVRMNFSISKSGPVTITIFTLDGDVVRSLQRGTMTPGDYSVSWDGRNRAGDAVARGMYFIRIVAAGIDEIRKVMVVRY